MILTGVARLGRDVEVRFLPDGTAVANLSLAYNYGKKDGEGNRPTTWVSAALWGERATKLAEYLKKGQQLSVVLDDVCMETFKKQDGTMGSAIKARVNSLEFVGKREERPAGEAREPATAGAAAGDAPPAPAKKGAFDDFESDIPF